MIKIHHLTYSRSTRIIWLLEELGLPYELVTYDRDANLRAPKVLEAVHPLGKAPVIEDGAVLIAESGAIIQYIIDGYGQGRLVPRAESGRKAIWLAWLHYAEGSAMPPILMNFIGLRAGGLPESMKAFLAPAVAKNLAYIAAAVSAGSGYLMAEGFMAVDIQMFYVLEVARFGNMLAEYPSLTAYLDSLEARPAFVKALEVGGPVQLPLSR
jgi:glutathione S-transferase